MPAALERVVRRCLEKDPEERFQSARDVAFALEALAGTSATTAGPAPAGARPKAWRGLARSAWRVWQRSAATSGGHPVPIRPAPEVPSDSSFPRRRKPRTSIACASLPMGVHWPSRLGASATRSGCARSMRPRPGRFRERGAPGGWRGRRTRGGWPSSPGKVLKTIDLAGGTPVTVGRGSPPASRRLESRGRDPLHRHWQGLRPLSGPGRGRRAHPRDQPGPGDSHLWPSFLPDGRRFLYQRAGELHDPRGRLRRRKVTAAADGQLPGRLRRERPCPVRQGTSTSGPAHGRDKPSPERRAFRRGRERVGRSHLGDGGLLGVAERSPRLPTAAARRPRARLAGPVRSNRGLRGRRREVAGSRPFARRGRLVVTSAGSPQASQLWIFDVVRVFFFPSLPPRWPTPGLPCGLGTGVTSTLPQRSRTAPASTDGSWTGRGAGTSSAPTAGQLPLRRLARREITGPGHVGRERAGRPVRPAPRRRPAAETAAREPVHGGLGSLLARRAVPRLCLHREHRRNGGVRSAVPADRCAMAGVRRRRRLPGLALGRPRALLPRERQAHGGGRPAGLRSSFVRQAAGPLQGAAAAPSRPKPLRRHARTANGSCSSRSWRAGGSSRSSSSPTGWPVGGR